jgi:hypothetical protein
MQQWSITELSPHQQRAGARCTHIAGVVLQPTYQRTRTRADGRTVTQLLFPLDETIAGIADSPARLAVFQERMRLRLRNIHKNPALKSVLTSIPNGRSCTRLVSENGIEFLIDLLYPDLESDAQLKAYREEAGVLELQAAERGRRGTCSSLPISDKHRLRVQADAGYALCPIRTLIERGGKLIRGVAGEAVTKSVLQYFLVWSTDVLGAARAAGFVHLGHARDLRNSALRFLMIRLQIAGKITVHPRGRLFVHPSGVPGRPELFACMMPKRVVRSEEAFKTLSEEERAHHWLGSMIPRKVRGRTKMVAVYKAFPYLIEGETAWNKDPSEMPAGEYEVCGRLGAPGSVWSIIVF